MRITITYDKNVISQSCTKDKLLLASESHSQPWQRFKVERFVTRFWMVLWPRGKLLPPPNLNSNANPKPSPNKNRGAIFLGGNCPDTVLNTSLTLVPKNKWSFPLSIYIGNANSPIFNYGFTRIYQQSH